MGKPLNLEKSRDGMYNPEKSGCEPVSARSVTDNRSMLANTANLVNPGTYIPTLVIDAGVTLSFPW